MRTFASLRSGLQPPPRYADGIHLDFAFGTSALGHYVKAAGSAPTIAAFTTLFTFTGGNQSYYRGPAGLLVAAVTNTPRIEYNTNGNCLGLLMESARTNLGLHSNDGTNAAWVSLNATAAKTATGPDGVSNSATTLTATAGNGTCLQTVVSLSAQRTFSIWLKRRTGTGNIDMTVDGGVCWTTKTITSSLARYSITQTLANPVFGLRIVTSGDEVDFWCAQIESAPFMSSSIPTTTASVARTVDTCIRTLGTEYSATAGTVVVFGTASGGQESAAQRIFVFHDGTDNERIHLARPGSSDVARVSIQDGGVNQATLDAGSFTSLAKFRSAIAWAANDFATSFDGSAASTDTGGTLPTMTSLEFGLTNVQQMNGHIRKFDYSPVRLPNGFLTSV